MATPPLRVFLVEDSVVIRQRISEALAQLGGIEIVGSADAEDEAVRALREIHCDVVVLDLQLRQGNGLGVLKTMRAAPGAARPLYIVFTNYDFPHYRAKSAALGADHFF
ncbi:MAG TPA: response regulator, partial [Opitutus sp.]|nr:response regulator [Opitutus sp.]